MSAPEHALEVLKKHGLVDGDLRYAEWTDMGFSFLAEYQQEAINDLDYREPVYPLTPRKSWPRLRLLNDLPFPAIEQINAPTKMNLEVREIVGAIASQCFQWFTGPETGGKDPLISGAPHGAFQILTQYGLIAEDDGLLFWTPLGDEVLGD